jgi:hypothetical protein
MSWAGISQPWVPLPSSLNRMIGSDEVISIIADATPTSSRLTGIELSGTIEWVAIGAAPRSQTRGARPRRPKLPVDL